MFNAVPYWKVNREERFFCFLFGHALLSSRSVRVGFAELAKEKCDMELALDPDELEVYVEVAATITWADILAIIADSDIDAFTRNALDQLKKYSSGMSGLTNALQGN
jgi:hypothetical protein